MATGATPLLPNATVGPAVALSPATPTALSQNQFRLFNDINQATRQGNLSQLLNNLQQIPFLEQLGYAAVTAGSTGAETPIWKVPSTVNAVLTRLAVVNTGATIALGANPLTVTVYKRAAATGTQTQLAQISTTNAAGGQALTQWEDVGVAASAALGAGDLLTVVVASAASGPAVSANQLQVSVEVTAA